MWHVCVCVCVCVSHVQDWGLADQMLREAYRAFQYALELNPNDTRALGKRSTQTCHKTHVLCLQGFACVHVVFL